MKKVRFLLVASLLLALALTLSCSDDKGGWLTCKEFYKLIDKCSSKYDAECNGDEDCEDNVDRKIDQCVIKDACNGTGMDKCEEHYYEEGCLDNY